MPITFGTFACCLPGGDDDRDGRARFDLAAGARRLADHLARRRVAFFFGDARGRGRGRGSAAPRGGAGCRPGPGPWPASGPLETTMTTLEPWVAVAAAAGGSEWITVPSSTAVGVDAFRPRLRSRRLRAFRVASSLAEAGGRRHLAAAGPGADRQRHLRLRAEEGEEGAVELGLVGRRRGRRVLLEHVVGRRRALDVDRPWRPRSRCVRAAGSRRCAFRRSRPALRWWCRGSAPGRSGAPIRTAAIAATIQRRRRLRASSSGSTSLLGLDRQPRPPAAAPRSRRCHRRRPAPSGPRRGRR